MIRALALAGALVLGACASEPSYVYTAVGEPWQPPVTQVVQTGPLVHPAVAVGLLAAGTTLLTQPSVATVPARPCMVIPHGFHTLVSC